MRRTFLVLITVAAATTAVAQVDYFHRPSPFAGKTLLTLSVFDEVRAELKTTPELNSREDGLLVDLQKEFDQALKDAPLKGGFSAVAPEIEKMNAKYDVECLKLFSVEQAKRLKQLFLQFNGGNSLTNTVISGDLTITDEEKARFKEAQDANAKKVKDAYLHSLPPDELHKLLANLQAELKATLEAVLTPDQQTKYKAMQGDKFEFKKAAL